MFPDPEREKKHLSYLNKKKLNCSSVLNALRPLHVHVKSKQKNRNKIFMLKFSHKHVTWIWFIPVQMQTFFQVDDIYLMAEASIKKFMSSLVAVDNVPNYRNWHEGWRELRKEIKIFKKKNKTECQLNQF